MKTLLLVCGPAAIGKSTFSKGWIKDHPDEAIFIMSADEVRKEMYGGYDKFPPKGNMMYVYNEMIRRTHELAKENENLTVIYDTTMLYDERRLFFVRQLKEFDYRILVLLKLTDYNTCLKRNKMRPKEKWVPDDVILSMASHYEDPSEDCKAHFQEVHVINVD